MGSWTGALGSWCAVVTLFAAFWTGAETSACKAASSSSTSSSSWLEMSPPSISLISYVWGNGGEGEGKRVSKTKEREE